MDTSGSDQLDLLKRSLRAALDHAAFNGHVLDRDCQGCGPGEAIPVVRSDLIEACIEGSEAVVR